MDPPLRFPPLSPELIPAWQEIFGPKGASYLCWCTYFRLRPKLRQDLSGEERRDLMRARIEAGPPPGLLAMRGGQAIGWMQIGPRADVPEWNNPGRVSTPLPDAPAEDHGVWAVSCFFFAARERGRGLSHAMLAAGLDHARAEGARLVEAAPMDRAKQAKSIGLFVGSTAVFRKAGFAEVACRKPGRPLMRYLL